MRFEEEKKLDSEPLLNYSFKHSSKLKTLLFVNVVSQIHAFWFILIHFILQKELDAYNADANQMFGKRPRKSVRRCSLKIALCSSILLLIMMGLMTLGYVKIIGCGTNGDEDDQVHICILLFLGLNEFRRKAQ